MAVPAYGDLHPNRQPAASGNFVQGPCLETGPRSYNPFTGAVTCIAPVRFDGTIVGEGLLRATGWVDPLTGDAAGELAVLVDDTVSGQYDVDFVGSFTIDGATGEQVSTLNVVRGRGRMALARGSLTAIGTATLTGIEAIGYYEGDFTY